jgi:leucine dehydrogenase
MEIFEYMAHDDYEQLSMYTDNSCGLRALIAIHDTTLGPALGGCRIWPHASENEALEDVLRLAKAMSYKSAAAGLPFGGGKALIIADPQKDKTEGLFRAFGRFVDTLGGRYLTTEDVGTTLRDMEWTALETKHVTGLPESYGSSGDPSKVTGFGVFRGLQSCAQELWGTNSLAGKTIAIQGYGKVAQALVFYLLKEENVQLIVTDLFPSALNSIKDHPQVSIVDPNDIYSTSCDIFSPCALGGILNKTTIPKLKCQVVCGGANNQLETIKDGELIQSQGILYAPDYIVNAGGVINISCEIGMAYNIERAMIKTNDIFETMKQVIQTSKQENITTALAADNFAESRINAVKQLRRINTGL